MRLILLSTALLAIVACSATAIYLLMIKGNSDSSENVKNNTKLSASKLYTGRDEAFSFEYPAQFEISTGKSKEEEHVLIKTPGEESFGDKSVIGIAKYPETVTPQDLIDAELLTYGKNNYSSEDVIIGGIKGKRINMPGSHVDTEKVYVVSNDGTYSIMVYPQGEKYIDNLIKSWKFSKIGKNLLTEKVDTSNWRKFTSPDGGFEMLYPPDNKIELPEPPTPDKKNSSNLEFVTMDNANNNSYYEFNVHIFPYADHKMYMSTPLNTHMCDSQSPVQELTLLSGMKVLVNKGCEYELEYFIKNEKDNILAVISGDQRLDDDPILDAFLRNFKFTSSGPNQKLLAEKRAVLENRKQGVLASAENAEMRVDVKDIAVAIGRYITDNRKLPMGLSVGDDGGISKDEIDICSSLVPKYLQGLPVDPDYIDQGPIVNCASDYTTGYYVEAISNSKVKVEGLGADFGEEIFSYSTN